MNQVEKKTLGDRFINLLWNDILFEKILPLLSIRELFILRGLSSKYKQLIDSYFSQLKYLNLGKCLSISPNSFKVLSKKCSQLKTIILTNCLWLTDELIIPFFENNPYIKKLVLNNCKSLSSVCLQPVIINCKNLESLLLAGCNWLTLGCLESITLHQRNLVEVDLSDCYMLSNMTALHNFIQLSSRLKSLNLSNVGCVNDLTMSVIAHSSMDLEMLNIKGCQGVTSHGVRFVIEYCPKLKAVICLGCPFVIPHNLKVKHRPNLRVVCNTPISNAVIILPRMNV